MEMNFIVPTCKLDCGRSGHRLKTLCKVFNLCPGPVVSLHRSNNIHVPANIKKTTVPVIPFYEEHLFRMLDECTEGKSITAKCFS